jgi:hypothetical protein
LCGHGHPPCDQRFLEAKASGYARQVS